MDALGVRSEVQLTVSRESAFRETADILIVGDDWLARYAITQLLEQSYPFLAIASGTELPAPSRGARGTIILAIDVPVTDGAGQMMRQHPYLIQLGLRQQPSVEAGHRVEASWRDAPQLLLDAVADMLERRANDIAMRSGERRSDMMLTPRQREVLELIARGQSNADIARGLGMSENTVRIHVSAILKALRVSNRTQAALWAMRSLPIGFPAEAVDD